MNIVHELEKVLYHVTYMGTHDKDGVNLAVNDILDKIEELGFEIVERPLDEYKCNEEECYGSKLFQMDDKNTCICPNCKTYYTRKDIVKLERYY